MKLKVRFFLRPDGTVTTLYQDPIRALLPEIQDVRRVSDVTFDPTFGNWVSRVTDGALSGTHLASADRRSDCIELEHKQLETLMQQSCDERQYERRFENTNIHT
jgi:hypothetical protein